MCNEWRRREADASSLRGFKEAVYLRSSFDPTSPAPDAVTPTVLKGFVPTPVAVVDLMVDKLFAANPPTAGLALLDPGCGDGEFIDGVIRWCNERRLPIPHVLGVEVDSQRAKTATARFKAVRQVRIVHRDFLRVDDRRFDYVIGNPPYVPITGLSVGEREAYRRMYATATGRFDLYLLFFEQALRLLAPNGRLVFITPEKFLYVDTARPLRELLLRSCVEELHFLDESTFANLVTYPLISTITAGPSRRATRVHTRSGATVSVRLTDGGSWLPRVLGHDAQETQFTLADACVRVSCGVATGADSVYVVRDSELPASLRPFAHPTISGRQVDAGLAPAIPSSMLVPYDAMGHLLPEARLGALGRFLADPARKGRLLRRTCVVRKPWYAFHENPPMQEILRPKLLCKDITAKPLFVIDRVGDIVPRHSAYYMVPIDSAALDALADHLNAPASVAWLRAHCQRAANGFLRLQSQVIKRLPVPASLVPRAVQDEQLTFDVEARPA